MKTHSKKEVIELLTEYSVKFYSRKDLIHSFAKEKGLIKELEEGDWAWLDKGKEHERLGLIKEVREHNSFNSLVIKCIIIGEQKVSNEYEWAEIRASKATDKEVQEALIDEAKRRRLTSGVRIKTSGSGVRILKDTGADYTYFPKDKYMTYFGYRIFENGKWAEILPEKKEMTVDQIQEELGYEIKIVK